jgi:hypothetical protein
MNEFLEISHEFYRLARGDGSVSLASLINRVNSLRPSLSVLPVDVTIRILSFVYGRGEKSTATLYACANVDLSVVACVAGKVNVDACLCGVTHGLIRTLGAWRRILGVSRQVRDNINAKLVAWVGSRLYDLCDTPLIFFGRSSEHVTNPKVEEDLGQWIFLFEGGGVPRISLKNALRLVDEHKYIVAHTCRRYNKFRSAGVAEVNVGIQLDEFRPIWTVPSQPTVTFEIRDCIQEIGEASPSNDKKKRRLRKKLCSS